MGWACRHRRQGAVLALIALALQIVLAFGHVHLRGLSASSHPVVAEQASLAPAPQQTPAQNRGDDDDYCAICASIFLASSVFAPPPPQLLVPVNFQRVEHSVKSERPLADSLRLAFRSRAPPVA